MLKSNVGICLHLPTHLNCAAYTLTSLKVQAELKTQTQKELRILNYLRTA